MDPHPSCPACTGRAWERIGELCFERSPPPANAYLRLRNRVLFELWAPEQDRFTATFVLCDDCGFVGYTPRPTEDDIDAKYRLIAREEGTAEERPVEPSQLDRERSAELHRALAPHLPASGGRLLDFGGGSGALLCEFVAAGVDCGVVDYMPMTAPGVRRLGNTLDDLEHDGADQFDCVLCSHVFEHLADPVKVARRLRELVSEQGVVFVEVPLEIVGGPPPMREPVTHVSFFCETSLRATLERAGLEVLGVDTGACLFASGAYRYGVRAVARRGKAVDQPRPGSALARDLLAKGGLSKAAMAANNPRVLLNPVRSLLEHLRVR